jgi:hypothetical protein
LRVKQSDKFTASKKAFMPPVVPPAPLVGEDKELTPKAKQIFQGWFSVYSSFDQEAGVQRMTRADCAQLIQVCTDDNCPFNDPRVDIVFYKAQTKRGIEEGPIEYITQEDYLEYYRESSADPEKVGNVRENLFQMGYREDLTKLEEPLLPLPENLYQPRKQQSDMPRFKLSHNQKRFEALFSLLDVPTHVS